MNKVKEQVAAFSKYAKQELHEQETQLRQVKERHLLSGKLAQIKIFNEHLDVLKEKLELHMGVILQRFNGTPEHPKLYAALKEVYAECVNEYMCLGFTREKD